jgi:hypothetical protein
MRRSAFFAVLLLGLMVALTSMAWASPTDPAWIKGIYDDGDFDDVIIHLTSGASAIPALLLADRRPLLGCVRLEFVADDTLDAVSLLSPHAPRAPPAA